MEFQIKESFGKDGGSYSYFTVNGNETIDQLKKKAVEIVLKEWKETKNFSFILHSPQLSNPTINVAEYDSVKHCKIRKGIKFKTRWR